MVRELDKICEEQQILKFHEEIVAGFRRTIGPWKRR